MRRLTFILILLVVMARPAFPQNIKLPNVSGQFYDADPKKLSQNLEAYLKDADTVAVEDDVQIVIAPHAGYVYSGPVAGYSFKAASQKQFKTIVILAPSHFYGFAGASVWSQGGFQTPLGTVAVDEEFAQKLSAVDQQFAFDAQAYQKEHSLEVEIPFLQKTFMDFKIVPVILGQMSYASCQKLAVALDQLIGKRSDVLVVVSSDMSHYHQGAAARAMDAITLASIEKLDAAVLYQQCRMGKMEMCGFVPVTTALLLAQSRGLQAKVLKYAHSGDITGDNSRVVGYSSVIFYKSHLSGQETKGNAVSVLNLEQKKQLLTLARQTIENYVTEHKVKNIQIDDARLSYPQGAFVTIHKNGQLRGCIGHIVSDEPLQKTVRDMAIAAATQDPRFSAVRAEELKSIDLEISVLSRPWRIKDIGEIQMGVHGVIISKGRAHGVFLPQVATETQWSKEKFLSELCSQKANLPANCWQDPATHIEIFTADVFGERELL
ncbi:MAG: AmmeMemoRadiSam system protein B [Candidatus Omnitrophica bacterium]|nr:AmmeMemoRadiSam system protein B [Candidatus Omnitrophota bacterium]